MATRFYLRNIVNDLTGIFPTDCSDTSYQWNTDKTLRKMLTTIGAGQTSISGNSLASAGTNQKAFLGFWISPLLAAQTISGSTFILNWATSESNGAMNFPGANINAGSTAYIWRPSTGTNIGYLFNSWDILTGDGTNRVQDESTTEAVTMRYPATGSSVTASTQTTQDGDVIIFEARTTHVQSMASSYTGTFYFDGTTVNTSALLASVSNHASFVEFSQTLSFYTPPPPPVSKNFLLNQSVKRANYY